MRILPGAAEAVKRLNDLGYPVFVISNQQGVAKRLMSDADLAAIDEKLHAAVRAAGGRIERTYYCTHHKDDACACRKPNAGMLLCAAADYDLDLPASVFIGDTETDALAARTAGVGTFVLVLTGKFAGKPEAAVDVSRFPTPPDFVAADLAEAVDGLVRLASTRER